MKINLKKGVDLSSPFFIYVSMWSLLMYLYSLRVIDYYIGLNQTTLLLIFGSFITFALGWLIIRTTFKNKKKFQIEKITTSQTNNLIKWINKFLVIWLVGMLFTVIIQKGFPLLWMIRGVDKSYADFGFASIHGFLTSFYLLGTLGYLFVYFKTKQKKYIFIIFLLLLYPILAIHRSIMVLVFFEFLGLYLFTYKLQIKNILKVLVLLLCFIYAFGALGDYRLGNKTDFLYDWIHDDYKEYFEKIPSGFLWAYIYYTASLDNIIYNIDSIKPLYYPYYSTAALFPSVLRRNIYSEKPYEERYSLKMSNPVINTFTYFANYIKDFGIVFTLFIVFNLQLFIWYTYIRAKNNNLGAVLAYPIFFMALMLSTFADYFANLVVLFQIILCFYVGRKISNGKNQNYV